MYGHRGLSRGGCSGLLPLLLPIPIISRLMFTRGDRAVPSIGRRMRYRRGIDNAGIRIIIVIEIAR